MTDRDLLIVGAGPAGMSAAITAREFGLRVTVIDDQAAPGGQIYRNLEENHRLGLASSIGSDYARGIDLVRNFRACGAAYLPGNSVWQVNPDGSVYFSDGIASHKLKAQYVLFATGSMERPAVAPGWTLPGVMTVGAAQILQKTAQALPSRKVWIAGCGPLAVYYAANLAQQGHRIAGFLDTAVPGNRIAAARYWRSGIRGMGYLLKGLGYLARIQLSSMRRIGSVTAFQIIGDDQVKAVRWQTGGVWDEEEADGVLLHEGVVPHTQLAVATGCTHEWNELQSCFRPVADGVGQTSIERVLVAGDCSGIGGVHAATLQGEIAGAQVVAQLESAHADQCAQRIATATYKLQRELAIRPLLDSLYAPRVAVSLPGDDEIVCRCESITAGQVRAAVRSGCRTVDGVKSQLRCGMGPCQGRTCGLPVTKLVAHERGVPPDTAGTYRIRPPLKPITLQDLAALTDALQRNRP